MADTSPLRVTGNLDPAVTARLGQNLTANATALPKVELPKLPTQNPAMSLDVHSPTGPLTSLPTGGDFDFSVPDIKPTGNAVTDAFGKVTEVGGKAVDIGGKGVSGVGLVTGIATVVGALTGSPPDLSAALDGLKGLAESAHGLLTTAPLDKLLGSAVGGLAAIQGVRDLVGRISELTSEGRAPSASEVFGLISSGLQVIGGTCMAIAPFTGPAAPALAAAGTAAMVGAMGAGLTEAAIENWDTIQKVATEAWQDPIGSAGKALDMGKQVLADTATTMQNAVASAWSWFTGASPEPVTSTA